MILWCSPTTSHDGENESWYACQWNFFRCLSQDNSESFWVKLLPKSKSQMHICSFISRWCSHFISKGDLKRFDELFDRRFLINEVVRYEYWQGKQSTSWTGFEDRCQSKLLITTFVRNEGSVRDEAWLIEFWAWNTFLLANVEFDVVSWMLWSYVLNHKSIQNHSYLNSYWIMMKVTDNNSSLLISSNATNDITLLVSSEITIIFRFD
jgi:hypothetical protein